MAQLCGLGCATLDRGWSSWAGPIGAVRDHIWLSLLYIYFRFFSFRGCNDFNWQSSIFQNFFFQSNFIFSLVCCRCSMLDPGYKPQPDRISLGPDQGHGSDPGPRWTPVFSTSPGPGPGDLKKNTTPARPLPRSLEQIFPPDPVEWKKPEPGIKKKTLNRKNSLSARSKEPDGTSIESFHYIISQLSQRVEVLFKQGLLNSSV